MAAALGSCIHAPCLDPPLHGLSDHPESSPEVSSRSWSEDVGSSPNLSHSSTLHLLGSGSMLLGWPFLPTSTVSSAPTLVGKSRGICGEAIVNRAVAFDIAFEPLVNYLLSSEGPHGRF